ncbi:Rho GTPase activation protein [Scheffersomyces amazonensis]|uniref:Rho GTPase activation protein n=1 Tax=Scheffersomyces amazonensis TaxID=1078765 RepID=UPI00315DBF75
MASTKLESTEAPLSSSTSSSQSLDLLESEEIKTILKSDQSLEILLNRLKQSITTAEEFCKYLKKKAQIEDDYFNQTNRFAINIRSNFKHLQGKVKDDSFTQKLDEIIEFDQKISQVGISYVSAITSMFNELTKLIDVVSKTRKSIKDEGRRKEKDCQESIIAAEKAKQRYINLCEDLEKLRAMDPNRKQTFTLKNKSQEQQEQDLKAKIDSTDQDYKVKVATCKRLKDELILTYRPTNSRKLKDLILELDMAMNLQLQKFSTWNESLVINTGILINPLPSSNGKQSMKAIASSIDNGKDLYNYLIKNSSNANKVNKALVPIEYVQHHSQIRTGHQPFVINQQKQSNNSSVPYPTTSNQNTSVSSSNTNTFTSPSTNNGNGYPHSTTFSMPSYETANTGPTAINSSGPKDTPLASSVYSTLDPQSQFPQVSSEPSFGIPLEIVANKSGKDNVPLLVLKCIDIIEKFGLDLEGIYRTSANKNSIDNLKDLVDQKYTNYNLIGQNIDPTNVLDADIFCIASLLKNFFAHIPEGLLTDEASQQFIDIVQNTNKKSEQEINTAIHRLIFTLPDSSYFTLRALLFHLDNVASHESRNKMNIKNLSIIWGPVVLNSDSDNADDLSYKSLVIEKFLLNAHNIFYDGDGNE